ncbi:hypothetical protein PTKIN_Ptkin03bG0021300 [Pterospermum kingtungense]
MEAPIHYAIYSMSSDSWRVFKDEDVEFFRDYHVCGNFNNACVNGVYYWHTFKSIEGSGYYDHKVLALNLGTEVFQLIDPPFSKRGGHLLPLHDRIAIWDTDLLIDTEISNELLLYDIENEEAKELGIQTKKDWYFLFVHTYEESLVAIGKE